MPRRFEFHPLSEAAGGGEDSLAAVQGAPVPGGTLEVWLGPKIVGGRYFRLYLRGPTATDGGQLIASGLHNTGRYPGMNWVEIFDIDLPGPIAGAGDWVEKLGPYLQPVADAIPAGGHLMIEYEKPLWESTQLGLLDGQPPAATPLGSMLTRLGCGSSFKDWYFPEGGQEGGRKLQGNKPLQEDGSLAS